MAPVKETLLRHLRGSSGDPDTSLRHSLDLGTHELFWKLVEARAKPTDSSKEVLIHGNLNFHDMMFRWVHLYVDNRYVYHIIFHFFIFHSYFLCPSVDMTGRTTPHTASC